MSLYVAILILMWLRNRTSVLMSHTTFTTVQNALACHWLPDLVASATGTLTLYLRLAGIRYILVPSSTWSTIYHLRLNLYSYPAATQNSASKLRIERSLSFTTLFLTKHTVIRTHHCAEVIITCQRGLGGAPFLCT